MTTIPKSYIQYNRIEIIVYADRKTIDSVDEYKLSVATQEALSDIEAAFHAAQMRVVIKEF